MVLLNKNSILLNKILRY